MYIFVCYYVYQHDTQINYKKVQVGKDQEKAQSEKDSQINYKPVIASLHVMALFCRDLSTDLEIANIYSTASL